LRLSLGEVLVVIAILAWYSADNSGVNSPSIAEAYANVFWKSR
jgi:hypothetical protein